jgi:hypothetical protein
MTQYRISSSVSGQELGVYTAASVDEALDEMAVDAGYRSFEASCKILGMTVKESKLDFSVVELPESTEQ